MTTRTTDKQLYELAALINRATDGRYKVSIDHAYGGVRLESHGGSRDVSPRLTKGELRQWMQAFLDGLYHATEPGYYAVTDRYGEAAS